MKKSLVLAMAMALGVTASAYAANPFSDVPAGHWAYDSIDKLAAAGVIEGMGDGSYQGDRTMTRYEMAQIVAKAMAKGCNVDKLAAEFADELDALGVRVAKLEKKADNLVITGQVRYDYESGHGADAKVRTNKLRSRLFLNGQINEDWAYYARIQNDDDLNDGAKSNAFDMNQVAISGRIGGLSVKAGRFDQFLGNGNFYDDTMEMIEVAYGKKVNVAAFYGQDTENGDEKDELWGVKASTKLGVVGVNADYIDIKEDQGGHKQKAASATVQLPVVKNVDLAATYIKSSKEANSEENGYVVGVSYKGASASEVGSWGLWANYYDQGNLTYYAHTMNGALCDDFKNNNDDGFKGYGIGGSYTLAKNIVYSLEWYDFEGKKGDEKARTLYSRVQFTF